MELNPALARNILVNLADSKNGIKSISAKEFDISYKLFGAHLDVMVKEKLISNADPDSRNAFATIVENDETQVEVMIAKQGVEYIKDILLARAKQQQFRRMEMRMQDMLQNGPW